MSHDERPGRLHHVLGVIAAALLLGPLLVRLRLVPPMLGFVPFAIGGLLALVVAALALLRAFRGRGLGGPGTWAALATAALFVILAARTAGAPRINDFTTDLADPPRFTIVRVRPDPAGGSRVDVRSKSRDGKGDLGANAARIRAYLATLSASAGP